MLVRALVLNWFESGNTSFAHRLCGRRHPSYVDGDDALFCFGVLEETQTDKRASSASEAHNTQVRTRSTEEWHKMDSVWTVIKLVPCWFWTVLMCLFLLDLFPPTLQKIHISQISWSNINELVSTVDCLIWLQGADYQHTGFFFLMVNSLVLSIGINYDSCAKSLIFQTRKE